MSKLLIDDKPVMVLPKLAEAIGINKAIVLQQIHYWIVTYEEADKERHHREGKWWVYNTKAGWQSNFPWWSESTVWRALTELREDGLVETTSAYNRMGYDRTLWYTIDYAALEELERGICSKWQNASSQNDKMDDANLTSPIPETTTETTTEEKKEHVANATPAQTSPSAGEPPQEKPTAEEELSEFLGPRTREPSMPEHTHWQERAREPWAQWGRDSDEFQRLLQRYGERGRLVQRVGHELERQFGLVPVWSDRKRVKGWCAGIAECLKVARGDGRMVVRAAKKMAGDGLTISNPYSLVKTCEALWAEEQRGGAHASHGAGVTQVIRGGEIVWERGER